MLCRAPPTPLLQSSLLFVRNTLNLNFYGYPVSARQLLVDRTVPPPPAACMLYDALLALIQKYENRRRLVHAPQQQQRQARPGLTLPQRSASVPRGTSLGLAATAATRGGDPSGSPPLLTPAPAMPVPGARAAAPVPVPSAPSSWQQAALAASPLPSPPAVGGRGGREWDGLSDGGGGGQEWDGFGEGGGSGFTAAAGSSPFLGGAGGASDARGVRCVGGGAAGHAHTGQMLQHRARSVSLSLEEAV